MKTKRKDTANARDEGVRLRRQLRSVAFDLQETRAKLEELEQRLEHRDLPVRQEVARTVRRRLRSVLRKNSRVLVASKGDASLLDIPVQRVAHFPQDLSGEYAGFHPADDVSVVAHLEALRHEGYDTLVLPAFVTWWLDFYRGLRRHLGGHYLKVFDDTACSVYDLRMPKARRDSSRTRVGLDRVIAEAERRLGHRPYLLDWSSGQQLRQRFSAYAVATRTSDVLPDIDKSIDIVVASSGQADVLREARRVAIAAVVILDGDRVARVEWLLRAPGMLQASAEAMTVWVAPGVLVLPGATQALAETFARFPQIGAVGGRLLDASGRLLHAGGALRPDASLVDIGRDAWRCADPAFSFVRRVDFCSSRFMAVSRRALAETGGLDTAWPSGRMRDADFCLRLQERGYATYYQPDAIAVCGVRLTRAVASAAEPAEAPEWRRRFGMRWRPALQGRVSALDI